MSPSLSMRRLGNVEHYLLLKVGKIFMSKTAQEEVFWAAEFWNFV